MATADHDPDAAPPADAGLFGLPTTPDEARLVHRSRCRGTRRRRIGRAPRADPRRFVRRAISSISTTSISASRGAPASRCSTSPDEVARWNDERARRRRADHRGRRPDRRRPGARQRARARQRRWRAAQPPRLRASRSPARARASSSASSAAITRCRSARSRASPRRYAELRRPARRRARRSARGLRGLRRGRTRRSCTTSSARSRRSTQLVQVGIRDFAKTEVDVDRERERPHRRPSRRRRSPSASFAGETWRDDLRRDRRELPQRRVRLVRHRRPRSRRSARTRARRCRAASSFQQARVPASSASSSSARTIIGFDLNEVVPGPDGDEWDANVGARMLYKLCGWTLASHN